MSEIVQLMHNIVSRMNSVLHTGIPVPNVLGIQWVLYRFMFFIQINSWKEVDDKMIAVVHLDQKEIEDHQDWLG